MRPSRTSSPGAILFDLDGTFADTAPDLAAALNRLCVEEGLPEVPLATLRPHTSSGVRGMLGAGMGIVPGDPRYPNLYGRFLDHYAAALCVRTALFPGIATTIDAIESAGIPWGIVTNKQSRFTLPLIDALGYRERASCVVSGDSARRAKPDASPLLMAAALSACPPAACLYAGDDLRDIIAGNAAGMRTVAAGYGYLGTDTPLAEWPAAIFIDRAPDILDHIV